MNLENNACENRQWELPLTELMILNVKSEG